MTGLKTFKKIKVAGETVTICDLSVEYVNRMQEEDGYDNISNALDDACEFSYTKQEIGYKAALKLYQEIIKHTFGEAQTEGKENEKK